jgi:hypothetical protein
MAKQTTSNAQSGNVPADRSAPPFASRGGTPTNVSPMPGGYAQGPVPSDLGDGGAWDVDPSEVPQGGRVLRADPGAVSRAIGAVGNPGSPGASPLPFKNLK